MLIAKNLLKKAILREELSRLRKYMVSLQRGKVYFPIFKNQDSNRLRDMMGRVISDGRIEIEGEVKPTENQYVWIPPVDHTLYELNHDQTMGDTCFMVRSRRGKECFFIYSETSVSVDVYIISEPPIEVIFQFRTVMLDVEDTPEKIDNMRLSKQNEKLKKKIKELEESNRSWVNDWDP
jgi:hypothetical protein